MAEVCADASYILKLVLPEPESAKVRARWAQWLRDGDSVIAPGHWLFEALAVLRRKVWRGELTDQEGREAWKDLCRQGIRTVQPRGRFELAWEIAANFARATTYDTVYLAVAQLRGCEFWTPDRRLAHATRDRFLWVRFV